MVCEMCRIRAAVLVSNGTLDRENATAPNENNGIG
jgi:hypothetical protein